MTDHLNRQLAPTAALAAAAAVTRTLRIGPYVFANDFRHPLLVAREAATLDRLSGGRLDLGLGAGWRVSDYRQLGIPYDRPGIRVDRLQESFGIIRRLLSGEEVTHAGRFYQLDRARVSPLPVQQPHPRFMLGGGGPRVLRMAAREAQVVGFVPQFSAGGRPMLRYVAESGLAERVEIVRRAAGPRFDDLELNVFVADAGVVGRLAADRPDAQGVPAVARSRRDRRLGLPAVRNGRPAARGDAAAPRRARDQLLRHPGASHGSVRAAGRVTRRALTARLSGSRRFTSAATCADSHMSEAS